MLIKTQTNKDTLVEVGTHITFNNGSTDSQDTFSRVLSKMKLEGRMLVFDSLHGTNYRSIRHQLVAEQKRRDFEKSIGLIKR